MDDSLNRLVFVIDSEPKHVKLQKTFSLRNLSGKYRWEWESQTKDIEKISPHELITEEVEKEAAG